MNNYLEYSAEDFAYDPYFIQWVIYNDEGASGFWDQFLKVNPEKSDEISRAKIMVLSIHQVYSEELTSEEIHYDLQRLVLRAENHASSKPLFRPLWQNHRFLWQAIAAAAMVLLSIGIYFINNPGHNFSAENRGIAENNMLYRVNNSVHAMTVLLNDGSVVNLEPGSELSYPTNFQKEQRNVYLKGEAFFDVAKNPAQPFIVVTRKGITRVVGTSFRIRAHANETKEQVTVRTGKVSVYERESFEKYRKDKKSKLISVQLLPNQQAELNSVKGTLRKAAVTNPELTAVTQVGPSEITFENQPVQEVLHSLAKLYEVDITFKTGDFDGCRITTTFGDETLPERLNSICQAIGASYRISNDKIEFSGKGCPAQPKSKL